MTRTIAVLLAAAAIAGVAAPAAAQTKYFARERIVGIPKSTTPATTTAPVAYSPIYSDSYGACANNRKSKPIASCSASDGSPAKLSDCSSFPQSTGATDCNVQTCGMAPNTFIYYKDGTLPTQIDIPAGTLDGARAQAKQICEANQAAIACMMTRTTNAVAGVYVYTRAYNLGTSNDNGAFTGGACARN